MNTKKYFSKIILSSMVLLSAALPPGARAQLSVSPNKTAAQLVNALVGAGVTVSNVTMTCPTAANGTYTVSGTTPLGIANGIVLSTGQTSVIPGTASTLANTQTGGAANAALAALVTGTTDDACVLDFDFIPQGDTVSFRYQFASEEYTGYGCSQYNDVFAFFISGPGITGTKNIALIPGTNTPVTINSTSGVVGNAQGSNATLAQCTSTGNNPLGQQYINNSTGTQIKYDGFTKVFTAKSAVVPCSTYHLKIGIADVADDAYDSGVFIEGGSLVSIPSITALTPAPSTWPIAGGVNVTLSGTNFRQGSTVTIDGMVANVVSITPTAITFLLPAMSSNGLCAGNIAITSPSGCGTAVANFPYSVTTAPVIANVTPANATPGTNITISGTNFGNSGSVKIGNTNMSVVSYNNTSIVAKLPSFPAPCSGDIVVTNICGNISAGHNYVINQQPTITSVSVSNPLLSGGNTVTVTGSNFLPGSTVDFLGVTGANVTVVDPNTITFTAPAVNICNGNVSIATTCGNTTPFAYTLEAVPVLNDVWPLNASAGATLTLTGSNLSLTPVVTIGGINMPVLSATHTQVTVQMPSGVCGATNIALTNVCGYNSNTVAYSVPKPTAELSASGPTTICYGDSVVLNANTGTGYTYSWLDPNGDPIPDATGSSYTAKYFSGNYFVIVTANGCSNYTTINVVVNPAPAPFAVTGGGGYCFGATGAPIGLSGSQIGVDYQLMLGSNPVGSPVAGTGNALTFPNQTAAGTYSVVISNATGVCISKTNGSATVVAPSAPLNYNVTTANPDCVTPNSGSATVANVTGGISPYQYSVGTGAYGSSNVLSGLTPGVYQVNVKDAAGCVLSKSVSIIKPFCSVAANDSIVNCGGNTFNIPLSQLLTNDMIAAGDTIAIGDWSTNATGGGTVTYNSSTKMFTYTPPTQGFNGKVSFTYTIKRNDNTVAFSGNGHFYEFKAGGITWTNAKNAASTLFYNGMQGYLATVTSAAENAFINTKLQANGWMGASDLASEGTWRWVTGPEGLENGGVGRHFTNQNKGGGNCSAGTGSAVNGNYINWAGGEPNDCGAFYGPGNTNPFRAGEHVAHFYAGSGTWNDFPDNAGVDGYVVEYGGLEVIAPVTLTSTATVFINNAKVITSTTTTAPLCPGASNGTIAVSTTGGTMPYQYSKDNGANYQSSNSFAGLTAGNYAMKVKDANGCAVTHTANVAAGVDNTLPAVNCPSNITVNATTGICGAAVTYAATGTDNCTDPTALVFTYSKNSGTVFPVGTTTVTVTAKDAANNTSAPCSFTVTVLDVEAPMITLPANATVSCDGSTSTATNGTATATDNCGSATVSYTDASTQNADANSIDHYNYVITRTWKAVDAANNSSVADQIITVQDVTAPGITSPASVTVNCQDATTVDALGSASGSDNCSPVAISYTDASTQDVDVNNAGHYNYIITRTWKATDVTGNSITSNQTITVQDVTKPSVEVPANATVNCQDATTVEALGLATGSDNCGPISITYTDVNTQDPSVNNAGHYNYTITRTWKATDVTGNFSTADQTITVQDVTNPTLVVPSNTTVSCDGSTTTDDNGLATGSDNCGPVAITYTDASTQNASANSIGHYNYTITRTWKATDVTGNYVTGEQTITVHDVTAPTISCPANTYASCKTTTEYNGAATGSDNCGPVTITHTDASTKSANAANASYYDYTITRTWKVTDVTGNFTTANQLVNVSEMRGASIAVTPVNTINSNHPNHTIYLGYGPQSVTLDATVTGGVGNRTYSWSPSTGVANLSAATTSVAPTTTTTYTVTITDATGCTIQKSITINVIDVRCGNKVQICHFPPGNPGNVQQQCLPASAIAAHLAHGCKLGVCPQAKFSESEEEHGDDLIATEMKVYPNPTTGVFTIELATGMKSADVVIMDMTGKIIDRKTAIQGNRLQFDLSNVARGAYMIQTTSGRNIYRSRIVLQ